MAVGRTKKITRAEAGAYEKLTPNGKGVTAIASVNGRGSYAARYRATKAILRGSSKRSDRASSALSRSSGKVPTVAQAMAEAKAALKSGRSVSTRRPMVSNPRKSSSGSVAKVMAEVQSALRSTKKSVKRHAPRVATKARDLFGRAAKSVKSAARKGASSLGFKENPLRTRGRAVAHRPSSKKATKVGRITSVRSLLSAATAGRTQASHRAPSYEENMRRSHSRRARHNARRSHYGHRAHRNGYRRNGDSVDDIMAEIAAAQTGGAASGPKSGPKSAAAAPKARKARAPRDPNAPKKPRAKKGAAKRKKAAAAKAKAVRAELKAARAAMESSLLSGFSDEKAMKRARAAFRKTPKSAKKATARTFGKIHHLLQYYRPRTVAYSAESAAKLDKAVSALEGRVESYFKNPRRRRKAKANRRHVGLKHYEANRRRRHGFRPNRRRHARRNGALTESLMSALKTGLVAGLGFIAHRALTQVASEYVFGSIESLKTSKYKRLLSAAAVAAVGVPATAFAGKLLTPAQKTSVQAGMIVSLAHVALVDLLSVAGADSVTPYLGAYPEQYRGTGEYLATNGYGEYLSTQGYGEYLATNGYGEYLSTQGYGNSDLMQAAAGYGGLTQAAAGYGALTEAAAGLGGGSIYDGIQPDTHSAEYALSVAEATAGVGGFGTDEVSIVNPTDMALPIDENIQALRSGILEGGDGIFG